MVEHKLIVPGCRGFVDSYNLTNKWKCIQNKIYSILATMVRK